MRKVRVTDTGGRKYVVNTEMILYLREDHLTDEDRETLSRSTAIIMPGGLRISVQSNLEETVEKLGWHV